MSSWSKRKTPIPTKSSTTLSSCSRPHPFRRNLKNATYHPRIRSITRRSGATSRAPARVGKSQILSRQGRREAVLRTVRGIHSHELRHTCATLLLTRGVHPKFRGIISIDPAEVSFGYSSTAVSTARPPGLWQRQVTLYYLGVASGCRDCRTHWAHHRLSACETSAPSKGAFP